MAPHNMALHRSALRFTLLAVAVGTCTAMLAPSIVRAAAGDGIEGVQVGLKKKPGGQQSLSLGQGFVPCNEPGGNTANTLTQDLDPACEPAQTFRVFNGSSPTGWRFTEEGTAKFTAKTSDKNKVVNALNPPGSADVAFEVKAQGIADSIGLATSNGNLSLVLRESRADPVNGDMTVQDQPFSFGVAVVEGKVKAKTTLNAIRNATTRHGLPRPFILEIVSIKLRDVDGNTFAVPVLGLQ